MTALSGDRLIKRKFDEGRFNFPVKAGVVIYQGAHVVIDGAVAAPARTGLGLRSVGVAVDRVDNTGGVDGGKTVEVERDMVYCFANSAAADALTRADINSACYIVDDQTVAKTNGSNTRSVAGRVQDVDDMGVWVYVGEPATPTA
jgi:hypothetical protein